MRRGLAVNRDEDRSVSLSVRFCGRVFEGRQVHFLMRGMKAVSDPDLLALDYSRDATSRVCHDIARMNPRRFDLLLGECLFCVRDEGFP